MSQAHFPFGSLGSALLPTPYVSLIHGWQQLHFHSRQIQTLKASAQQRKLLARCYLFLCLLILSKLMCL